MTAQHKPQWSNSSRRPGPNFWWANSSRRPSPTSKRSIKNFIWLAVSHHQMTSVCNSVLRPPVAVPGKKPISNGSVLRSASVILLAPAFSLTEKNISRPPKAIPSQKYVYPDPIPEFASVVSQIAIVFSLRTEISR